MNLFAIGGVGVMQPLSGKLHTALSLQSPVMAYQVLFLVFGFLVLIGVVIYLFSQDRTD